MSRSASPFQGSPVRVIAAFSRTLDFNKLDAPAQCFLTTSTVSLYVRSGLTWGLCLLSAFRPLTASFGAVVCVAPRADYTIVLPAPHLSSRVGKRACFFCGVVVVLVVFLLQHFFCFVGYTYMFVCFAYFRTTSSITPSFKGIFEPRRGRNSKEFFSEQVNSIKFRTEFNYKIK